MSKIRMVFMGTADFAVSSLEALLHDEHFEVVAVVTQPDRPAGRKMQLQQSPVKQLAIANSVRVLTPENINDTSVVKDLEDFKAEIGVVVAFGQILTDPVIEAFSRGCVNVHGSLLPRWRGAAPIQRALMAGDEYSGVSLQKISLSLDAGDLIGRRKVKLEDSIDAQILYDRLKVLGADLLSLDLMDYLRGNLALQKQDPSLVTKAKKIKKEEGEIVWSKPAREIFNNFRGLKIWPGVWTYREGKPLKIHKIEMNENSYSEKPGCIVEIDKEYIVVSCGTGSLKIWEVQPESKPKMSVQAYAAGKPFVKGELLG